MNVWGIKDFYSNLERVSEEGSKFSFSYLVLVLASTLLATGGLLANSVPVIIGSMCIAPFLGSSRAVSVGATYKKWRTVGKGLIKQLFGLLAVGSTIAFLVTSAFLRLAPEIIVTPEIMARTLPTLRYVYLALFIAIISGLSASFVLVAPQKTVSGSGSYQELPLAHYPRLLDVTIGVEIAISLIPPASVVGIGLALGGSDIFFHSLGLLMINVIGLDIGGMIVLQLWRVEPNRLLLEKRIREIAEKAIDAAIEADEISAKVVLHSHKKADVHVELHAFDIDSHTDRSLARTISERIKKETGVSNSVRIIVTPVRMYESVDYEVLVPDLQEIIK